jgi:hypothetical protein
MVSNAEWLRGAFATPGATICSVARAAGVNEKTVRRWQKRHEVPSRLRTETASLRQAIQGTLPVSTIEVIEGELLGDGNLHARGRQPDIRQPPAARYQHTCGGTPGYVEWLATQLEALPVVIDPPRTHPKRVSVEGQPLHKFVLRSRSHAALGPVFDRWYVREAGRNRKRVPTDLVLTARMALHWYMGDGGAIRQRDKPRQRALRIDTHGFTHEEVYHLAGLLADFRATVRRQRHWRFVAVLDGPEFLEWIGPCPVPQVHAHKWNWTLRD